MEPTQNWGVPPGGVRLCTFCFGGGVLRRGGPRGWSSGFVFGRQDGMSLRITALSHGKQTGNGGVSVALHKAVILRKTEWPWEPTSGAR